MQMRRRRRSKKTSKSEEKRKENYVTRQLVVAKSSGKISLKATKNKRIQTARYSGGVQKQHK